MENFILKNEERAVFALRSLYRQYGYLPYKMSKFEEYDLYVRNKDFLVSDSVITFNDTNGRLLALKPDVTLSIIKNSVTDNSYKQKLYYNENVYRISESTHQYKEIMQTGIECIGDIDINDIFEVLYLAAKSLNAVSSEFVLDISHMGVFSSIINSVSEDNVFKKTVAKLISQKNKHETCELCKKYSIPAEDASLLLNFIDLYGDSESIIPKLKAMIKTEEGMRAYKELEALCSLLSKTEFKDKIKLDFSVVNDMNYYNGIVFKGFLYGISEGVLSGGEYGKLVKRVGKDSNAIGFAIYLDLLEALENDNNDYDVDVLLVYDRKCEAETLLRVKNEIIANGESVSCQCNIPEKLRYKKLLKLSEDSK